MLNESKKTIPTRKELLADLASRINLEDIRKISEADCRTENDYIYDAPKHYAPLLKIKETLETNNLDSWYPLEVVELKRWHRPASDDIKGHTIRAFCCAIILHTHCEDSAPVTSCDTTLGNLIQSLLCIDEKLLSKAESLYVSMQASELIDDTDKVLVPVAQLLSLLIFNDEQAARLKFEEILDFEERVSKTSVFTFDRKRILSSEHLIFDQTNEFFAKRDRPLDERSWQFISNYIYQNTRKIDDEKLKADILCLCKRLWNPQPGKQLGEFVIPLPYSSPK